MIPYRLNMARGQVIPPETRKKWHRWLTVYLVASMLVIGLGVSFVTRNLVQLRRQQSQMSLTEKQFLAQRPNVSSVAEQARAVSRELTLYAGQLESLDSFRRGRKRAAGVLLGLAGVLPTGLDVGNLEFDGAGGKVNFEVYVPADRKIDETMAPPRLIALWAAEPLLAGKVSQITLEKSTRVGMGGVEMLSWRFSGALSGGR